MSIEQLSTISYDLNTRLNQDEILIEFEYFNSMDLLIKALNLTSSNILILNSTRQIVYANNNMLKMIGSQNIKEIIGKRPGELVSCNYADAGPHGCGTDVVCKSCSALSIILKSILNNIESAGESSIPLKTQNNDTLNIYLSSLPYHCSKGDYYFLTINDMTDTIRKRELERIFFHDILNTSGAIRGILELLENEVPTDVINDIQVVRVAFDNMIEEINFQRLLSDAENRKIECSNMTIFPKEFINIITSLYTHHEVAQDKNLVISQSITDKPLQSDFILLKRVVGNMVKNALEASNTGDTVIIGADFIEKSNLIKFWVKNQGEIPAENKSRIFYKNFSSKGNGRGLGTYSMKIIGEHYLNGNVGFTSNREDGTIFYIELPGRD